MHANQMPANLSFLTGANSEYIAHLYNEFLINPEKVDGSWRDFFNALNDNESGLLRELHGASWTPEENRRDRRGFNGAGTSAEFFSGTPPSSPPAGETPLGGEASQTDIRQATLDSVRALMLIRTYRVRGHLLADLDPLQLKDKKYYPELDPAYHGFTDSDYDRPIFLNGVLGLEYATLREVLSVLEATYCGKIGVEFMHMVDPEEKRWIQQ
ncbi:MAG: 2-oxoglutarate dehydrogenase E1 component, partial [Alphaproteobacteria bacterium]|nr:2-oxoglutarate dehydrogenase E1 component [Alphaproteobacteria bacterium]